MTSTPPTPEPDPPPETGRTSRGLVLAAVVGGLVLVALVLVVTLRDPVSYPPDSPEATVQAFLQSVADNDPDTSLLAVDCSRRDLEVYGDLQLRAVITDTSVDDDRTRVDVAITEGSGGMFGDGYSHDETYWLVEAPDGWLIDDFNWPYNTCDGGPGEG